MRQLTSSVWIIGLALATAGAGASPNHVFQSDAATVWVAAAVTASDGRRVRGLTADQFIVQIDDRPAAVLERVEGPDLAVSVLIDASGSMFGATVDEIRRFVRSLPETLRPRDVASLGWFGQTIAVGSTFGRDRGIFDPRVREFELARRQPFTPSPLWDAMNATLTTLERQPQRRALITWSDGRATGNVVPFDIVIRHALNAGVTTSFLVPGMPAPTSRPDQPTSRPAGRRGGSGRRAADEDDDLVRPWERPRLMAEATGGTAAGWAGTNDTASRRLQRLIEELQMDYFLRVRVETPDGRLHPIDVRVKGPELMVRAPASVLVK